MPFLRYKRKTLLTGKSLGEYYIIFASSEVPLFPFIDKEISHCFAASWDGYNWAVINPAIGFTEVYILQSVDPDIRVALAEFEYVDIIHVSAWRKIKKWRILWPVAFTCVEQIKALLGISAWRVITPRQLYKYLGGDMATLLSKPKMPQKSADQLAAEKFQADEVTRLKKEESARKAALSRGKGGRASLLSGGDAGVTSETLG